MTSLSDRKKIKTKSLPVLTLYWGATNRWQKRWKGKSSRKKLLKETTQSKNRTKLYLFLKFNKEKEERDQILKKS